MVERGSWEENRLTEAHSSWEGPKKTRKRKMNLGYIFMCAMRILGGFTGFALMVLGGFGMGEGADRYKACRGLTSADARRRCREPGLQFGVHIIYIYLAPVLLF
jgi:hypothetical protein